MVVLNWQPTMQFAMIWSIEVAEFLPTLVGNLFSHLLLVSNVISIYHVKETLYFFVLLVI